jgi:hypothetical protein
MNPPINTSQPSVTENIMSQQESGTSQVAADLIAALYKCNKELIQPSEGPAVEVTRDPHLRLRRTLTPSLNKGIKKYHEAQFLITDSTGMRINLSFSALGRDFHMDAYVWGASEQEAEIRMVGLHGISPGVSRTRWHTLGEKLTAAFPNKVRFVALDWHSIDRSDSYQEDFLTLLPKHIFSVPDNFEDFVDLYPENRREWAHNFLTHCKEHCPREYSEGAQVLRAVIEQGLGWTDKSFIPCIKSWGGGLGITMLAEATRENGTFKNNIIGAVIMHPACFFEPQICQDAVKDIPAIFCWAEDDPLAPYPLSSQFLIHSRVKLVSYETGGHGGFDGTQGLPDFDEEVVAWMKEEMMKTKWK